MIIHYNLLGFKHYENFNYSLILIFEVFIQVIFFLTNVIIYLPIMNFKFKKVLTKIE